MHPADQVDQTLQVILLLQRHLQYQLDLGFH